MNKIHRDIDKIDDKLFKLLKSRLDKTKQLAKLKKFLKDKVTNESREQEILDKMKLPEYAMYQDELEAIYATIFEQMKNLQTKELNKLEDIK